VHCLAHQDDPAFARSLGDRGNARQAAQRVVISALQGIGCFCEQRGEDDSADARQGSQDRHVTLLSLVSVLGNFLFRQLAGERVELGLRLRYLPVDEVNRPEIAGGQFS
jgi:uncharacterized iron-regulated protein